ncbi:MAG: hypothetical protein KC463_07890, partial [Streptococcus sp.]|nr:hypothetical protein [Streptococcus sp.]
ARNFADYSNECLKAAKKAVVLADQLEYELSMTGHSLGAYLAELSLYHSGRTSFRAVTFESPGCLEMIEELRRKNVSNHHNKVDLNKLDITTYLHNPNVVNTLNRHVGQVIHLKNKPSRFEGYFYGLDPLIEFLFSHGIDSIIKEFDVENEMPKNMDNVFRMINWPKVKAETIAEFLQIWKTDASTYYDIFNADSLPDEIKLKYSAHYEKSSLDITKVDRLNSETSDDKFLLEIYRLPESDTNDFIIKQLLELKSKYTIEMDTSSFSHKIFLISSTSSDYTVADIREIMKRLIILDNPKLQRILLWNTHDEPSSDMFIADHFGRRQIPYFVKTDSEIFKTIDTILHKHQFMFIFGRSGFGKTTLAIEYAYYWKNNTVKGKGSVQFFNADSLTLYEMKNRFFDNVSQIKELEKEDDIIFAIKSKLCKLKIEILCILDNVEKNENCEKILNSFTGTNSKFIITSKRYDLFPETDNRIEIKPFDQKNCIEFLKNSKMIKSQDDEKEWINTIQEETDKNEGISPKVLEMAVKLIREEPKYGPNEIKNFIETESKSEYDKMIEKNSLAYEILKYLSFIDGSSIEYKLIKLILIEKNSDELDNSLKYLMKRGYINKKQNLIPEYKKQEKIQNDVNAKIQKGNEERNKIE